MIQCVSKICCFKVLPFDIWEQFGFQEKDMEHVPKGFTE